MNEYKPSLARLALLARKRSKLLASLLAIYQEQEGADDQQLAKILGCDLEALPRLALCQRPRPAPHFREDIERIASYAQVQSLQLVRVIRSAEAIEHARQTQGTSFLMAARDHSEETTDKPVVPEDESTDE